MKQIIFRMTAFSAAAGKYNPEAPLDGNEDNFYVDDDLNDNILGRFQTDEDIIMSDCGCLMVVADGMGGMNAGEVASAIAIETVRDYFAPGKISPKMAESPVERRKYLELVIKEADRRIKTDSKNNELHKGMGSTIILAWIVGDKMTISWCGDSRAYRYNPTNGLELLSRDHSYVQELVNQGVLKYEETFDHPQGNIVTRSLGEPNNPAKPETRQFDVYNNDIILLCSDGLSGVLRDRKTKDHNGMYYPGENIEDIIANHQSSMTECRNALMDAAEKADWYDNVTVLLCQIESGAGIAPKYNVIPENTSHSDVGYESSKKSNKKIIIGAATIVAIIAILCVVFYNLGLQNGETIISDEQDIVESGDTIKDDIYSGEAIAANVIKDDKDKKSADKEDKKKDSKDTKDKSTEEKVSQKKAQNTDDGDISQNELQIVDQPEAGVSQWKLFLLNKLSAYSQPALKKVVNNVRETITSASDDDKQKCDNLIKEVGQRAKFLNRLQSFNGKLTKKGTDLFNALLLEIGDPREYHPDYWNVKINELNRHLKGEDNPAPTGDQSGEEGKPDGILSI